MAKPGRRRRAIDQPRDDRPAAHHDQRERTVHAGVLNAPTPQITAMSAPKTAPAADHIHSC